MTVDGEQPELRPVEAIHYYAHRKRFVIEVAGGPVFSLIHSPDGVFYELLGNQSVSDRSVEQLADEANESGATGGGPSSGRSPTVVLTGRLQGLAAEGRPDRQQRPTAWARFLAHIEGQEGATLLSTSFHGRTRDIALGLPENAQITAQGYLRLREDADVENKRLSSFSVVHLVRYPGKPDKGSNG